MDIKLEEFEILLKNTMGIPVERVLDVRSRPACGEGENFCSFIYRVELDLLLESGKTSTLLLIAKLPPTPDNKVMYDHVNELGLFTTELKIYKMLFPAAESVIKQKNFPNELLWPMFMGTNSAGSVILLDDLKDKGYRPVDVEAQMDFDHALFVMKTLGTFHAINIAVVEEGKVDSTMLSSNWLWTNETMANKFFVQPLLCLSRVMKDSWGSVWSHVADRFHDAHTKVIDSLKEIFLWRDDRLNVINHGDAWTANILFKYDDHGRPNSAKLIDFQASAYNTFAIDLTNFLYTSVKPKVRRESYNELLEAYRSSLADGLRRYGLEWKERTNMDAIIREMERLKFFGFLMLVSIHAFCVTSSKLKIALEEMDKLANGESVDAFEKLYTDPEYRSGVEEDFLDFLRCGVL